MSETCPQKMRGLFAVIRVLVNLLALGTVLQGNVSEISNTVGILGYRLSVFGHKVVCVHPGSPVEGILKEGDCIVAVDGDNNRQDTRGEPGTEVTLKVLRGSSTFECKARRIPVQD